MIRRKKVGGKTITKIGKSNSGSNKRHWDEEKKAKIRLAAVAFLAGVACTGLLVWLSGAGGSSSGSRATSDAGRDLRGAGQVAANGAAAQQQVSAPQQQQQSQISSSGSRPRIVTVVQPSVINEQGAAKRLKSIHETWGPLANAVYIVNNIADFPQPNPKLIVEGARPEAAYQYPQVVALPSVLKENQVGRMRFVIEKIYENIDPDFALFVNDHTFVIPDHLCGFIQGQDPSQDFYAGHALQTDDIIFNSGAAGYFLSRKSMERLVKIWKDGTDPTCSYVPDVTTPQMKKMQQSPGLYLTACLKNGLSITPIETREDHKYHRFNHYPLIRLTEGKVDDWYIKKHTIKAAHVIGADDSYAKPLFGEDCCAKTTLTFHYVEFMECKALFDTRQKLLGNPSISDAELKQFMVSKWPKSMNEIGGYSRALPGDTDTAVWETLLKVVRKISLQENQSKC
jgi:hypothetical protein